MKILTVLLIFFYLQGCSQSDNNNNIVIGKKDIIYSKILKENRTIWIHVPHSAGDNIFNQQRYPVLYLLDGDGHFMSVVGLVHQLSEINGNTVLPDMIVVGIPNTDRQRDLTPTHSGENTSGGGEAFASFIEHELMPYVDSLYPTAPYKIFIGHSLGGLTVVNTLIHHPQMFNAYLAIDPSMWWDDQLLLKAAGSILTGNKFNGKTLFLGVANTMAPGMDTAMVRRDTSKNTIHIRSILLFADALRKANGSGLRWEYRYYKDDNHGSVPLISEYNGLRFIFNYFDYKDINKLFDSSFSAAQSVSSLMDHYHVVSREMGYTVFPTESFVNNLGYAFMQNKQNEKAFAFFEMNIENYPKSGNVYDSMGDFYVATGDKEKAIDYFRKALSVRENADTRQKLQKLEQK
jgi:predicted alpha/beta superfamily hydrolase